MRTLVRNSSCQANMDTDYTYFQLDNIMNISLNCKLYLSYTVNICISTMCSLYNDGSRSYSIGISQHHSYIPLTLR